MTLPSQRTVLVVTGLLAVAAFVVPFLAERVRRWPRGAWLLLWTGSCVGALQAPTLVLLAQDGEVRLPVALVAACALPGSCLYGWSALRRHLAATESERRTAVARSVG